MKYILKYSILSCLLSMIFSCAEDITMNLGQGGHGDTFADGIEIGISFPDMQAVNTRGMYDENINIDKFHVFLFVFDGNSLKTTIHIPSESIESENSDNTSIKFTAYLPQTDNNAVVHIVALDDEDGSFARQVDEVGYGLEDVVMPKFNVSGDKDAYWQRIELGCPIIVSVNNSIDPDLQDVIGTEKQVKQQLQQVKLIRNFACIQLSVADGVQNFDVLGWTVVNDLDGGSVVPWFSEVGSTDIKYPDFINFDSADDPDIFYYDYLVGQGFSGVSYGGAELRNTMKEGLKAPLNRDGKTWGKGDKYIYERKVSSVNPLYILIYGSLQGNPGYYKVSLGHRNPDTGLVTEYNVLRNVVYRICITGVTDSGYKTADKAASAPAFNNVSGDVTTRSMLQISDGVDMLYVNFVTYVVTQKDEVVKFRYRYLENIIANGANNVQNGKVIWNAMTDPNNAGVGLKTWNDDPSAIVQTIDGPTPVKDEINNTDWNELKLTFPEPTDEIKEQKFIIYTPPVTYDDGTSSVGLSRTINLIVRNPWDYERVKIVPGLWEDDKKFPDWDTDVTPDDNDGEIYIGPNMGAGLTLFFELPAGLPMSMFPMSFVIESDRQNIENAPKGNCAVQNGESLFKEDQGVNDLRIQYVKTVNWEEYAPNGENSTHESRIIRARFLTTTDMSTYPADVDNIVSTVRIHNQAFKDADYKFTRKKGNADGWSIVGSRHRTIHIEYENIWDFSDPAWDEVARDCSNSRGYSKSVNGTASVKVTTTITENGSTTIDVTEPTATVIALTMSNNNNNNNWSTRCFISGEDSEGDRYFLTRYNDDTFTFSISNNVGLPSGTPGSLTSRNIAVLASGNSDDGSASGRLYVGNNNNNNSPTVTRKEEFVYPLLTGSMTIRSYDINAARVNVRFYQIKVTEVYDYDRDETLYYNPETGESKWE